MRQINKSPEPISLTTWKRHNLNKTYRNLKNDENAYKVRIDIRNTCITEQYHLCAYCCNRISIDTSHNEHIQYQDLYPQLSLIHNNIVASCNNKNHCGHYKKNNSLILTPLISECETEIKYYLNGKVEHFSDRAEQTISVLGLDNKALIKKRKELLDTLIYSQSEDPAEIELLDIDLLSLLIEDLKTPDKNYKLESFSPVLVNVLSNLL